MKTYDIDYAQSKFEYPVLDKIHGEPTYHALKRMKEQLKRNAQSVISDLGGGAHGHLGLVLTAQEYTKFSQIPYAAPRHPGPLQIPRNTDSAEAVRLREEHDETIRLFRESLDVEKALTRQIVAALEP